MIIHSWKKKEYCTSTFTAINQLSRFADTAARVYTTIHVHQCYSTGAISPPGAGRCRSVIEGERARFGRLEGRWIFSKIQNREELIEIYPLMRR